MDDTVKSWDDLQQAMRDAEQDKAERSRMVFTQLQMVIGKLKAATDHDMTNSDIKICLAALGFAVGALAGAPFPEDTEVPEHE